jgi:hypothetical protein
MFSIILILILYSNLFKINLNSEILVSIFSTAIPIKPKRTKGYMPKEEKFRVSNNIPNWFKEILCGIMLSDGSIRMIGSQALMSIQQNHKELTFHRFNSRRNYCIGFFFQISRKMCFQLNLVLSGIHIINRPNKKLVYSFQTLTLPFFTSLYNDWYKLIDNKYYKVLPLNLDSLFTPLAFAFLIMADGSWDNSSSRIIHHLNNFTLIEVNRIQSILLSGCLLC